MFHVDALELASSTSFPIIIFLIVIDDASHNTEWFIWETLTTLTEPFFVLTFALASGRHSVLDMGLLKTTAILHHHF